MTFRILLVVGLLACIDLYAGNSPRQGGTSIYFTELGRLKHQADLGDPNAQFRLGNLYLSPPENTSIKENLPRAADYYFKAAIRGHAGAQYNLGVLYYQGNGIDESKVMAFVWFTLVLENDSLVAKNIKRIARKSLDDTRKILNETDVKAASEWLRSYRETIVTKEYRLMSLPEL